MTKIERFVLGMAALSGTSFADPLDLGAVQGAYHRYFENSDITGAKHQGDDVLEIVKLSDSAAYFRTHLDFFNGHTCGIWGVAEVANRTLVYKSKILPGCTMILSFTDGKATLSDDDGACRAQSCGARGGYHGASFDMRSRRTIRYLDRLKASREFKQAIDEAQAKP